MSKVENNRMAINAFAKGAAGACGRNTKQMDNINKFEQEQAGCPDSAKVYRKMVEDLA